MRQQAWDTAAELATQGVDLPSIVSRVLYAASPRIDQETVRAVPSRGRTFWATMATALVWVVAVYVTFSVFESAGTHAVPALKLTIYLGVLVWAVGFGIVAANHKVRERRTRVGAAKRAALEQLARSAAAHVWASEVPGAWQPLGPAPVWSASDETMPTAWIRRLGLAPGQASAALVDGTEGALRRLLRSPDGTPVVLFVGEPGFFTDDARDLADAAGVALFVAGRPGLVAMSAVASSVLAAYRQGGQTSPADLLTRAWAAARSDRARARSVGFAERRSQPS